MALLTKDRSFYKNLFTLALPIALQNLVTYSIGLADNIMIGYLGDGAVSGVYMGNQVQTLLQLFSVGIEGALLVLGAQYWGKRDTDRIRTLSALALRISLAFGVLLSVICLCFPSFVISLFTNDGATIAAGTEYLSIVAVSFPFFCITQMMIAAMRSVEAPRVGFFVSLTSLFIDIALNYVLIFGKFGAPALGVRGAAIATLVARIAETVIVCLFVFVFDKKLAFRPKHLLLSSRELTRDFIHYGTPIVLGQLVWAANMMANSVIMGHLPGEGVVAAVSVTNALHNLTYVVMNGMSGAVGIITGKTIGAGQEEKMKEYAKTVQVLFLALGVLTGGAVFLLKKPFVSLYHISEAAQACADTLINVITFSVVGTCYQAACLFGLVKSGGDVGFVFLNDCIFVFLVVLPSALIASALGAAPWVVFLCLKSDQFLKCIVAAVKINRFRWMKNLTRA